MFTPTENIDYWDTTTQYSSYIHTEDMLSRLLLLTFLSRTLGSCDRPLGLQSGEISDSQLMASSSFSSAVGPTMVRLGNNEGGGAWCPSGLISVNTESLQWIQVDLRKKMVISGVSVQGRWGGGVGQEWTPELSLSWYDMDRDLYVQTSDVYTANSDTNTVVRINVSQPIITNIVRIIPMSQHPRAVCLRLELHGCDYHEPETDDEVVLNDVVANNELDITAADQKIETDNHENINDDRKEISGETVTVTDQKLFPILVSLLATCTIILVIISVVLLRRISTARKQVHLPANNDVQYFQNSLPNNYTHQPPQLHIKKNIYEVPKVEPIYSTPIEIFYPSSPSTVSTESMSECETFKPHLSENGTISTSIPRQPTLSTFDSYKSQKIQKIEDLVTFSPFYSYFTTSVEPKYSNIV